MPAPENKLYLNHIIPDLNAHNVKQVYQEMGQLVSAHTGKNPATIFDRLMACENRETSGIGDGVAIPHLSLSGLQDSYMAMARLQQPIDFNAVDARPVDLVFLLISPEKDGSRHLSRLAGVTRMFRNEQLRQQLRGSEDKDVLQALLLDPQSRLLAA